MIAVACCRPTRHQAFTFARPAETAPRRRLPIELLETRESYEIRAELPGVAKDAIAVEISDQRVTISAEPQANTPEGASVLLAELSRAKMDRRIELPEPIDADHASARHADGVLYLSLPKRNGEHSRRLVVD